MIRFLSLIFLLTVTVAQAAPYTTIQMRRDTVANWTSHNPVLAAGEVGCEMTGSPLRCTSQKVGDGVTAWTALPYTSRVTSMNKADSALQPNTDIVVRGPWVDPRSYGADATGVADSTVAVQTALDTGKPVKLIGTYRVTAPLILNKTGQSIKGDLWTTKLLVDHAGDVFQISAQLATFRDFEVAMTSDCPARTSGAIFNVLAGGGGGSINDIRVSGRSGINCGRVFREDTHLASGWRLNNIQISGGATWKSIIRLSADPNLGTVAGHYISGLGGTAVTVTDAGIDLEGGVDTVALVNSGLDVIGGPMLWTHNSYSGFEDYFPRWVHATNCYAETGGTTGSTALKIDAGRDIRWNGYIASSETGLAVGTHAHTVDVSHSVFTNIGRSAVTIAAGSSDTILDSNTYLDTGLQADSTYDVIAPATGAGWFRITNSRFEAPVERARYNIGLKTTSDYFTVTGNDFVTPGTMGDIANVGAGTKYAVFNNPGVDNRVRGQYTFFETSPVVQGDPLVVRSSITNDQVGTPLVLDAAAGVQVPFLYTPTEMSAASAPNKSLFVDSADHVLKYKDNTGTVNPLY